MSKPKDKAIELVDEIINTCVYYDHKIKMEDLETKEQLKEYQDKLFINI